MHGLYHISDFFARTSEKKLKVEITNSKPTKIKTSFGNDDFRLIDPAIMGSSVLMYCTDESPFNLNASNVNPIPNREKTPSENIAEH